MKNRVGGKLRLFTILMRRSVKMKVNFHFSLARINKKAGFTQSGLSEGEMNPPRIVAKLFSLPS